MKILINTALVIFIIVAHSSTFHTFDGPLGGLGILIFTIPISIAWICTSIAFNLNSKYEAPIFSLLVISTLLCVVMINEYLQYEFDNDIFFPIILLLSNIGLATWRIIQAKNKTISTEPLLKDKL